MLYYYNIKQLLESAIKYFSIASKIINRLSINLKQKCFQLTELGGKQLFNKDSLN